MSQRMESRLANGLRSTVSHVGHVHFALIRLQRLTKFMFAFAPFSFVGRSYRLQRTIIV